MSLFGIIIVVIICGYLVSVFINVGVESGSKAGCSNSVILWIIILFFVAIIIAMGYDAIKNPYTP